MRIIAYKIDIETAIKRMLRGINGTIRTGNNPYHVTKSQYVRTTEIMVLDNGIRVFLVQLYKNGKVIAVGHVDGDKI